MANTITGRVIAVSNIENIPSKKEQGKVFQRRQLYMDCTRYDPYTGERGFENTPLLEFGGKGLEQLNALVEKGLKKGDIVTVTFDINGTKYQDQQGKTQVFTAVRPYAIEKRNIQGQEQQQEAQQPAPEQAAPQPAAPAQAPQQTNNASSQDDGLPF